jgi:hypothetical protein
VYIDGVYKTTVSTHITTPSQNAVIVAEVLQLCRDPHAEDCQSGHERPSAHRRGRVRRR